MMTAAGIIIVIATFYAIIKNYETRLVLILGGVMMGLIGGQLGKVINVFSATLVNKSLTPLVCIIMGFGLVLRYTGCSNHIVNLAALGLKKTGFAILPLTVIVMFLLNICLVSASGLAAAVGVILIPVLIRVGIHPAIAGAAVLLGTWGSSVSPASAFVVQVAEIAKQDTMVAVMQFINAGFLAVVVAAVVFTLVVLMLGKKSETLSAEEQAIVDELHAHDEEPINLLKAIVPVVPIVLLVLGSPMFKVIPNVSVENSMLIGTLLAFLTYRKDAGGFMKEFFKGMGEGFVDIIVLMAAAAVFIQGMMAVGLVDSMIAVLKESGSLAAIASVVGPMVVAILSGSGNAAILAFNGSVTPFAAEFGLNVIDMGMVAQTAGNIGRTMSPVAGVTIICAKMAGVNTMQLVKYTALPCIAAALTLLVVVFYL